MQLLTAAPRQGLTEAAVIALQCAPTLRVRKGLELLRPDLSVREDISLALFDGTIKRDMAADVHGTCDLTMSRELTWGVDLVRPYRILSDGRTSARWNMGVFCLSTPTTILGASIPRLQVSGYDRLQLLQRQVGRDYAVEAGTTYDGALRQAFADAGLSGVLIDSSAAALTLPARKTWPLVADSSDPDQTSSPVTWLRVVNDLLDAISYRGVWCDENGYYRCQPYVPPGQRAIEYAFTADTGLRLLGPTRTRTRDVWATPNRWVLIARNPPQGTTPSTANGLIWTYDNLAEDTLSQAAYPNGRGLVYPSVATLDAADAPTLAALGARQVAADRSVVETFAVTTSPFPGAGHADVYSYADAAAGGARRVQATSWTQPLGGGQMDWTWQTAA